MISTHQTKINTFTQKDMEVSQNSRFANENAGKKDWVFLARWLGSPETSSQKHPSAVGCDFRHRLFGQVGQRCVQAFVERCIEVLPLVEP
jgi:hypothetical protein